MDAINTVNEEIRILTVKDLGKTLKIGRDNFPMNCARRITCL